MKNVRTAIIFAFSVTIACTGQVSEDNRPCPCADGWTCCANVCVAPGVSCNRAPDAGDAADVSPSSAGDAGTPPVVGSDAAPAIVGPTYPCGAGQSCVCPAQNPTPAPYNDAGQQVAFAYFPPPGQETSYSSLAEFNGYAVGRWQRVAGQGELQCEVFGVEITSDDQIVPMAMANDGTPQPVPALAEPLGLTFQNGTPVITGNNAPVLYDAGSGPGSGMQLFLDPWLANYVKVR